MAVLKEAQAQAEEPVAEEPEVEAPAAEEPETPEKGEDGSDWPDHLPEEQQAAFESAVTMLYDVLYKNPETGKAVLDQIIVDDEPTVKVEGVARACVLLVQQIDEKLDVKNEVMPFLITTVVDAVIELAEKVKKVQFDDNDSMAALSATADGVRALFGGEEEQAPPAQGAPPEAAPAPGAPV